MYGQCNAFHISFGRFLLIESEIFFEFVQTFVLFKSILVPKYFVQKPFFKYFSTLSSHRGCGLGSISFSAPSAASSKSLSCQQLFCLDISSNIFSISELWQDYLQDTHVAQTGKHFSHFAS